MLVRWLGYFLVAMAVSVATYSVVWPRVSHVSSNPTMSPVARKYLDQAITLLREQHINSAKMDWPSLTRQAYAAAEGAKTTADTYPAIWLVIKALGEKHTFLVDPDHARAETTGKSSGDAKPPEFLPPTGQRLANGVGVIRLFGFLGPDEEGKLYAQTAQTQIEDMKAEGVCRFVLDLREDKGGNMYPMLAGVRGLLKSGVLGFFLFPNGQYRPWALQNGAITELPPQRTLNSARRVPDTFPVAVLIGPDTASAGEYTAMSFEGRPETRFFGSASAGYVTANTPIALSDGAILVMTGAWGFDRTGKKYVDRIEPDEDTGVGKAALLAAVNWLSHQSCNASQLRYARGRSGPCKFC